MKTFKRLSLVSLLFLPCMGQADSHGLAANVGFHTALGVGVGMAWRDLAYKLSPWDAMNKDWVEANTWTAIFPALFFELGWMYFRPETDGREIRYQWAGCMVGSMFGWRF